MNRALTDREKVLLLILVVLLLALGYFKLVFTPIQEQIRQSHDVAAQEKSELTAMRFQLAQMREMEKSVEAVKADNTVRTLPTYDNSGALLRELHGIFAQTGEYTVDFSSQLETEDYLVLRRVELTFETDDYARARDILNALSGSRYANRISDLSIREGQGAERGRVQTALTITYFEIAP